MTISGKTPCTPFQINDVSYDIYSRVPLGACMELGVLPFVALVYLEIGRWHITRTQQVAHQSHGFIVFCRTTSPDHEPQITEKRIFLSIHHR